MTSLRFLNRGVEAKGLLKLGPVDPTDVADAPLAGQVVGTLRDLKGTRLPLISDFDQTFSALQSGLTPVNITGTLGQPVVGRGRHRRHQRRPAGTARRRRPEGRGGGKLNARR